MIVKDESEVIERCLASVKPLIDHWIIVDTGSSDGTQKIIQEFMKDVPGKLYERKWVDFSHNRNEAMALAKGHGDYLLFIDADERLPAGATLPPLTQDYYMIPVKLGSSQCLKVFLIKNSLSWKWQGVLHEELVCEEAQKMGSIDTFALFGDTLDGNRSKDPNKYRKDAQVLEKALLKEPNNSRYVAFLGQSYLSAQDYALALKAFEKRVGMGGREEEVYWAAYNVAKLQEQLNYPSEIFIANYCKAHQFRPTRAEPLFSLAHYYFKTKNFLLAYLVSQLGSTIAMPQDVIYVESAVYEYQLPFLQALSAFELGKRTEALKLLETLQKRPNLPLVVQQEIKQNIRSIKAANIQANLNL